MRKVALIPFESHIGQSRLEFVSLFLQTTDLQMSLGQVQNVWALRTGGQASVCGQLCGRST